MMSAKGVNSASGGRRKKDDAWKQEPEAAGKSMFLPPEAVSKLTAKDFTEEEQQDLRNIFFKMLLTRRTDERLVKAFRRGAFYGTYYSAIGQEASTVVPAYFSDKTDFAGITERCLGCCIARGMTIGAIGVQVTSGRYSRDSGTMHPGFYGDTRLRILTRSDVCGSQVPVAIGAALALKMQGSSGVSLCYFGDGAAAKGEVHEAMNFAGVLKLPVVFVCINNWYGWGTPINLGSAVEDISSRAKGYGLKGVRVDGNDVPVLYQTFKPAFEKARNRGGPTLVQCDTYRQFGMSEIDPDNYRSQEEKEKWLKYDPLENFAVWLLKQRLIKKSDIAEYEQICLCKFAESFGKLLDEPRKEDCLKNVYAGPEGRYLNKE